MHKKRASEFFHFSYFGYYNDLQQYFKVRDFLDELIYYRKGTEPPHSI